MEGRKGGCNGLQCTVQLTVESVLYSVKYSVKKCTLQCRVQSTVQCIVNSAGVQWTLDSVCVQHFQSTFLVDIFAYTIDCACLYSTFVKCTSLFTV